MNSILYPDQDGNLHIASVARRDIGNYACHANNGYGTIQVATAYLDVHCLLINQ